MLTTCLWKQVSQICAKKFQIWVYLCFGNVLKLKVTKGELIISNGLEMPDDYLPGGGGATPPLPLLGLRNKEVIEILNFLNQTSLIVETTSVLFT